MKIMSGGLKRPKISVTSLVLAPLLSVWACGAPINVKPLSPDEILVLQSAGNDADEKYVIIPGDTLQIRYLFQPDMNQEVVVQPDGKITAALVGQIPVANMTTTEVARLLEVRTSDQLRNPEVVLSISRFAERNVYVGGEVGKPGLIRYQKGLTPLQAIIAWEGFSTPPARIALFWYAWGIQAPSRSVSS
jgi:protein involved in polysaccharide export with SLBB domain